jgi:MATE family multidrug resistance protein
MALPAPAVAAPTDPGRDTPTPALPLAAGSAATPRAAANPRGVLALAWPSLVENLLLMMLNTGSLMMVGHLGARPMASVGAAGQISNVIIIVFSGIAAGTTALVARAVGAGNGVEARAIARQSLLVGVAIAGVCGLLGFTFAQSLVGILGVAPEVTVDAVPLVRVACLLLPVLVSGILAGATLRGAGDTRTPMWNSAVANLVNLSVAYVAIYGLGSFAGIGVDGVAAGWIAGQGVAGFLGLRALARQRHGPLAGGLDPMRRLNGWRIDLPVLRRIAAVGGPAAGEYASIQVGMIFFSIMVVRMGTAAFASQQAIFTAANVSMLPGLAFSVAATTLVGQHLGAGDPASARAAGWRSMWAATAWMTIAGVGFITYPEPLLGVFTSDPDVIAAGATGIRMVGFGQPLQAAAFVLSGALRGAGDTRTTLVVGSLSMWIVRLGLAWTFGIGLGWGVAGIWLGWCADWCVRGASYIYAFHRGAWQKVRV